MNRIKEQELLSQSTYCDVLHRDDYELQDRMDDAIAFKTTNDPDVMHCHEAMKESDRGEFIKEMIKEVEDHVGHRHWELAPREKVPAGTKALDSVCSMKIK